MKKIIIYLSCLVFTIISAHAFANIKSLITLTKEYTYQASELDDKTSCRAIALEQVKRELLEEIGTLVESRTVVQDSQIQNDEIRTLTGGVVQTKIIDEKWDGKEYWLKAQVSADPDEVAASIEKLKNDDQLLQELAESRSEAADALKEVERLKTELAQASTYKAKQDQYNQAVNQLQAADSFQQGTAFSVSGNNEEAAKAYDRVIYLRPDDAKAYFNRSVVYINMGNYNRAATDINRAMLLKPANTNAYYQRAAVYKNTREAIIANVPPQQQIPGQPNRGERPKKDPLQRFLDKKQIQHNLVRVSPQNRKPSVMKDQKQYNIQVQGQSIQRKEQPIADRQIILERKKERRIEKAQQEKNRQLLNRPAQNVQPRKELTEEQKKRLQQSAQTRKKSAEEQKRKFQPNKKAYEEERPKHYP